MISIIIAYDDNDLELGDYFEKSFNDLYTTLINIDDVELKSIRGLDCTEENVIGSINSFDEESFGFVGLSHGNESQLLTNNDVYVDVGNISHFTKSLFYSTACSSAVELGEGLIENECLSYVGFNKDSSATFEDFYDDYIKCENYCLKNFLSSNIPLVESFDKMLAYFDEQIDILLEQYDDEILVAMELIGNRDSLVLIGKKDLTKSDLK